jgi:hypothetical protein
MIRLDSRDWLKLRAKEARNFILEEGKQPVYLDVGHFQALKEDASAHKPGERRCPLPSPLQRLGRILLRIISKTHVHADAGPFLDPVSDRELPQYKEIVPYSIDLGKIPKKARQLENKRGNNLFGDRKLHEQ